MVKTILRDIRAVDGVTGVALVRKRDGYREHIFPAAFTEEHSAALYNVLSAVYRQLRGFSRLMLFFSRVNVHLYNQPELLLLVTTLPDHDQRVFELVVNSKFAALERALDNIPVYAAHPDMSLSSLTDGTDPTGIIVEIVNSLSDKLVGECGRLQVSQHWRDARKEIDADYPILSIFTVDGNGHWALRKGQQPGADMRIGQAWAELLISFMKKLGPLQALGQEILNALVESYRGQLDQTGFLHFLKFPQSKNSPART